ncbi:MAG: hypothetical protein O2905_05480 [Proteobacteria bacterium]|nr:hypothetical protein [Pseudomonadota bacterium]
MGRLPKAWLAAFAAFSWTPPALADGYGDLIQCARLAEPLLETAAVCGNAIKSGDLTEAQVGEALLYRGIIAYMLQQYPEAHSDLMLSVQYAPELARAYFYRGLVYEAEGEDRRADSQYRNAFAFAPEDPEVLAKMRARDLMN